MGNNLSRLRGLGRVFKNGHEIARVHYALTITGQSFGNPSRTMGYVRPVRGQIDIGEVYLLRLEDGTDLEFFARYTNGIDHPRSTYSVTVRSEQ